MVRPNEELESWLEDYPDGRMFTYEYSQRLKKGAPEHIKKEFEEFKALFEAYSRGTLEFDFV
jgi:hypothetical protein